MLIVILTVCFVLVSCNLRTTKVSTPKVNKHFLFETNDKYPEHSIHYHVNHDNVYLISTKLLGRRVEDNAVCVKRMEVIVNTENGQIQHHVIGEVVTYRDTAFTPSMTFNNDTSSIVLTISCDTDHIRWKLILECDQV